jgi:hypothetical protein
MLKKNKFLITNYNYKFYAMVFTSLKLNRLTYLYYFQRFFFFFKFFDSVRLKYLTLNFYLYNYIWNHCHGNLHFLKPLFIVLNNIQVMPIYLKFFKNYLFLTKKNITETNNALFFFFNSSDIYKNNFIINEMIKCNNSVYSFNSIYSTNFNKSFYIFLMYLIFSKSVC